MSNKHSGEKCIKCNVQIKKFTGKVKRIVKDDGAVKYQEHCTKNRVKLTSTVILIIFPMIYSTNISKILMFVCHTIILLFENV